MVKRYKRVIMYGPPNCGKGTHARVLGSLHGFRHLSTGDLFRERRAEDREFDTQYGPIMDTGGLLQDDVTLNIFIPHFRKIDPQKAWTLDGVPRSVVQLERIMLLLKERDEDHDIITFNFTGLDEDVLLDRASRRTLDNGDRRNDDSKKWIFYRRMMYFYRENQQLLQALRQHTTVIDILANREVHEIRGDIFHELGLAA